MRTLLIVSLLLALAISSNGACTLIFKAQHAISTSTLLKRLGMSSNDLMKLNPTLSSKDHIRPGDELCISDQDQHSCTKKSYVTSTVSATTVISRLYLTSNSFYMLNPTLLSQDYIRPSDEVCVSDRKLLP